MVLPDSDGIPPVPTYSGYYYRLKSYLYEGFTPIPCLSIHFQFNFIKILQSYNPELAVTNPVWANPRSLATTCGITFVFFSYGYLDVSVPRVRHHFWFKGLPHSEIFGSFDFSSSPKLIAA